MAHAGRLLPDSLRRHRATRGIRVAALLLVAASSILSMTLGAGWLPIHSGALAAAPTGSSTAVGSGIRAASVVSGWPDGSALAGGAPLRIGMSGALIGTALPAGDLAGQLDRAGLSSAPYPIRPLSTGVSGNTLVSDDAYAGSTLVPIGGSSNGLLTAAFNYGDLANASGGFVDTAGALGIELSTSGTNGWTVDYATQATNWTISSNPSYTDVFQPSLTFQPWFSGVGGLWSSPPSMPPQVASDQSGTDSLVTAPYGPVCFLVSASSCFSSNAAANASLKAPWGVASILSTDGGQSWATPVPIFGGQWYSPVWYGGQCSSTTSAPNGVYALPNTMLSSYALAMNTANDTSYVAWTDEAWSLSSNPWDCTYSSGTSLSFDILGINWDLKVATSASGGIAWGKPVTLASQAYSGLLDGPNLEDVHLAVGPAPRYVVYGAVDNFENAPSGGYTEFDTFNSTNNGKSWSGLVGTNIAPAYVAGAAPDGFFAQTVPILTPDNWSSSAYKGRLYLVWAGNDSPSGTPGIEFAYDSSTGWTSTVLISDESTGLDYYDPSVAVSPNGSLWVSYLAINSSDGSYQIDGTASFDGGSTWLPQFAISDQRSTPSDISDTFYGGWTGLTANASGASAAFSDCRSSSCLTSNGDDWVLMSAALAPIAIGDTASDVTVNSTVSEAATVLTQPLPTVAVWPIGESVTVGVDAYVLTSNHTDYERFVGFSGAVGSARDPSTFTYSGAGSLTAVYSLQAAGQIQGTIHPQAPGMVLTVTATGGPTVSETLSAIGKGATGYYSFTTPAAGGVVYTVHASATNYQSNTTTVVPSPGKVTNVALTLARTLVWINGTVNASVPGAAANATVAVNGSAIPGADFDPATAKFHVELGWGDYYVNVTETGFVPFRPANPYLVDPGSSLTIAAGLKGSWINGTVTPGGANVTIDGVKVATAANGAKASFVAAIPGGTHEVNVSSTGFASQSFVETVAPGAATTLVVTLSNHGLINGSVVPDRTGGTNAVVRVNGIGVQLSKGNFSISEPQSSTPYNITAALPGYYQYNDSVLVTAGETSWANLSLVIIPPPKNCTNDPSLAGCAPPPCTSCTTSTGPSGTLTALVGLGVVVLVVAIAAALILQRRRAARSAEAPTEEAPPEGEAMESETYGGEWPPPEGGEPATEPPQPPEP